MRVSVQWLFLSSVIGWTAACDSLLSVVPEQNVIPTAFFEETKRNQVEGGWKVFFDASKSNDDSEVMSFIWDFGDGTSSQTLPKDIGESLDHTYAVERGTFVVSLQVRDNDGDLSEPSFVTLILEPNRPPIARFVIIPETGPAPLIVTLDATESTDPDEDDTKVLKFTWDFDDGPPLKGTRSTTTEHIYWNRGVYLIELTVSDGKEDGVSTPKYRFLTVE